jgi:hypothetical protein
MTTFGVFNIETKELFQFDKYEDALNGYMQLVMEHVKHVNHRLAPDWYLVYINDGKIVQFEQFNWNTHCRIVDLNKLDEIDKYKLENRIFN